MENLFEALRLLESIAERILREGSIDAVQAVRAIMLRIRIAARLAIVWPFVLLLAAMCGYGFAQWAVPTITILALLVFLWMLTEPWPLGLLVAQAALSEEPSTKPSVSETKKSTLEKFVAKAHEVTRAVKFALGIEILVGIYFSYVPIANDRRLALTLVLIVAALVCFIGGKTKISKIIVGTLVVAVCAVTLLFYLHGKAGHKDGSLNPLVINFNIDRRVEAKTDEQSQKPSAGQPTPTADPIHIQDPAASARTTKQDPPPTPKISSPAAEIMPISGDEGTLRVRILAPCRYPHVGETVCEGYFENLEVGTSALIYLDDSSGVDDNGTGFNVWLSDGSIKFKGGGYIAHLIPGMKAAFEITIRNRSGIGQAGLNLKYNDGHAHWYESDFANIPVALN